MSTLGTVLMAAGLIVGAVTFWLERNLGGDDDAGSARGPQKPPNFCLLVGFLVVLVLLFSEPVPAGMVVGSFAAFVVTCLVYILLLRRWAPSRTDRP
ncbi:MAG: hypothetical protein HND42_01560 [Armatimonadetes bacterium]|nr:hypothetical protein [Armatimonadota bacterium]NOG91918.1 hypothetical protein [Armatimonadota bacterium]